MDRRCETSGRAKEFGLALIGAAALAPSGVRAGHGVRSRLDREEFPV
jgi:hypothetical protein